MEDQIRESLLRQKSEKDILLKRNYIPRNDVPFRIQKDLNNSDIIKVILGPRRSGKSIYGINALKEKDFIYINFDDQGFTQENNHNTLIRVIKEIYPFNTDIFLDEIQNLPQWELFVSLLHRQGYNVIITGSNSKLLSKELSSRLTGRYIEGTIFPFSLEEYLSVKIDKSQKEISDYVIKHMQETPYDKDAFVIFDYLKQYLEKGGYPVTITTDIDYRNYLDTLFNSILFEDIVKRYEIRTSLGLSNLAKYLLSIFSKEYSYTKLKNILGFKHVNTVQSYINYLEEAFLIFSLNRYSTKFKEQINSSKKSYIIDNGFISALYIQGSDLQSRLLENQVFIQLLRYRKIPNQTLFYYKTKNKREIDFIIKDEITNKVSQLIQVCYSIQNEDTKKREMTALIEASKELDCKECIIITWNNNQIIQTQDITISCIPILSFLLRYQIK